MKIGGIILVIFGLLCLPQGIIFIIPGIFLVRRAKKKKSSDPELDTADTAADSPQQDEAPPSRRPSIPPVSIPPDLSGTIGTSFGSWDISIHGADGQDVRFDRALFQNILIRSYDSITGMAEMLGTHGDIYQTDLDHCSCEDFQRRGLPCKHIYKLALSRGYSVDAFFSARSDVVWYADGCKVYHKNPECRGLRNRYSRRSTVSMAEYRGLRPCKSCCKDQ